MGDSKKSFSSARKSEQAWLHHNTNENVLQISERIASIVEQPLNHAEKLQIVRYQPGGKFNAHFDTFQSSSKLGREYLLKGGQRTYTALLYFLGIGQFILVLTMMLMLQLRMRQNKTRDLIVGGLSGSLTTSIGMPGPPILLYFSGTHTKKEKLRGTTLAFYLFIYLVSLVIQVMFAGTSKIVWVSSLWALPLVFIGLFLGQVLFKWVNQNLFWILTYLILLFTGMYLLIEGSGLL
ncbi:TSUP family transporter [Mesobacillus thioparans]|uniref:TSUP family transporter n=1 Tax=Mesobacillus thioparans TaxID=370439 RepID=UPI0039F07A10